MSAKQQRVVFITEYMTSGSLKNFIKLAQKNKTKVGMKVGVWQTVEKRSLSGNLIFIFYFPIFDINFNF